MFLLYPFAALANVAFALLTWALAPLLALLVQDDGNLPRYLYWFQTFDVTCDYCRDPASGFGWTGPLWWTRVRWLVRNPAYGFDMFLLGVPFKVGDWKVFKDTPTCFFAVNRWGAFSYRGTWFKWGWKAWAGLSGVPNQQWLSYGRVPIVVLR